jgi:hypothetical protein
MPSRRLLRSTVSTGSLGRFRIPLWLKRVESIFGGAYKFLPEVYNAYRYLIEHVIASASTELSRGLLDLGVSSPLLDHMQSQLDVQHFLQQNDEVQAAAAAVAPPPVPAGFATPAAAAFALGPDDEFEHSTLFLPRSELLRLTRRQALALAAAEVETLPL